MAKKAKIVNTFLMIVCIFFIKIVHIFYNEKYFYHWTPALM
jgi:hypothetical protein